MPQAIIFDVEATDKNNAVIIEAASLDVTSINPLLSAILGYSVTTLANQLAWVL